MRVRNLPLVGLMATLLLGSTALAQTDATPDGGGGAATMQPEVDSAVRIRALEDRVAKDPTDADSWTRLGILYTDEGLLDEARDAFISALQAAPQEPLSHLNLGMVLVRMERWDEAQLPLSSFRMMAPEDVRGHALLGRAYAETDDVKGARRTWLEGTEAEGLPTEDAVILLSEYAKSFFGADGERNPSYEELGELASTLESKPALIGGDAGADLRDTIEFAYLDRARLALEDDRTDDALENWAKVRSLGSDNDQAWLQPAREMLDAGDVAGARTLVDEARTRRPDAAIVHFLDGLIREEEGDDRAAATAYRRAIDIDPEFPGVYAALGEVLAHVGDTQGAADALAQAVNRGEGGATASFNMGLVLSKKNQFSAAIPHLEKAVALDPSRKDAYRALGTAYRKTDQFTKAAETYQHVVDSFGPDASDLYQLGFAQAKIDRNREAARNFSMVSALQPDNWRAHYSLGNALREIEEYEKAIDAYAKANALEAGNYAINYNLALSMQLAGRLEEALEQYELTLEIRETRAIYVNMAICYTNLGDEDTANEYYAIAEELRKNSR